MWKPSHLYIDSTGLWPLDGIALQIWMDRVWPSPLSSHSWILPPLFFPDMKSHICSQWHPYWFDHLWLEKTWLTMNIPSLQYHPENTLAWWIYQSGCSKYLLLPHQSIPDRSDKFAHCWRQLNTIFLLSSLAPQYTAQRRRSLCYCSLVKWRHQSGRLLWQSPQNLCHVPT